MQGVREMKEMFKDVKQWYAGPGRQRGEGTAPIERRPCHGGSREEHGDDDDGTDLPPVCERFDARDDESDE